MAMEFLVANCSAIQVVVACWLSVRCGGAGLAGCGAACNEHTGVGAFKRVLPLICDATFGVQRGAGFTVSMLQMLTNLDLN